MLKPDFMTINDQWDDFEVSSEFADLYKYEQHAAQGLVADVLLTAMLKFNQPLAHLSVEEMDELCFNLAPAGGMTKADVKAFPGLLIGFLRYLRWPSINQFSARLQEKKDLLATSLRFGVDFQLDALVIPVKAQTLSDMDDQGAQLARHYLPSWLKLFDDDSLTQTLMTAEDREDAKKKLRQLFQYFEQRPEQTPFQASAAEVEAAILAVNPPKSGPDLETTCWALYVLFYLVGRNYNLQTPVLQQAYDNWSTAVSAVMADHGESWHKEFFENLQFGLRTEPLPYQLKKTTTALYDRLDLLQLYYSQLAANRDDSPYDETDETGDVENPDIVDLLEQQSQFPPKLMITRLSQRLDQLIADNHLQVKDDDYGRQTLDKIPKKVEPKFFAFENERRYWVRQYLIDEFLAFLPDDRLTLTERSLAPALVQQLDILVNRYTQATLTSLNADGWKFFTHVLLPFADLNLEEQKALSPIMTAFYDFQAENDFNPNARQVAKIIKRDASKLQAFLADDERRMKAVLFLMAVRLDYGDINNPRAYQDYEAQLELLQDDFEDEDEDLSSFEPKPNPHKIVSFKRKKSKKRKKK